MIELSQFEQLKDLNELKSRQSLKFVVIPENLKAMISFKTLLNEATWSDLGEKVNVLHILKDRYRYLSYYDELDLIDLTEIYNVIVIDNDRDDLKEFAITFENKKVFKDFIDSLDASLSDAVYLKLNDQMIEELVAKTREAQMDFYDRKIAKSKLDIKLATAALKEYEELKEGLKNES